MSDNIILRIQAPPRQGAHYRGIIQSLLSELIEILSFRKRSSSLVHFSRERLSKGERRMLLHMLEAGLNSLITVKNESLNESHPERVPIPQKFSDLIISFINAQEVVSS